MSLYSWTLGQNQSTNVFLLISTSALIIAIMMLVIIIFMVSRYRKFPTTVHVIHFRNGIIKRASKGGSLIEFPLIDEVITLPATMQHLDVLAHENIETRDGQLLTIELTMTWHVIDPVKAYERFSWNEDDENHVNKMLAAITQSEVRKFCFERTVDDVKNSIDALESHVLSEVKDFVNESGIMINKIKVKRVTIGKS